MLTKSQRVGTRLFDAILKSGRINHSPLFSLRTMSSAGPGHSGSDFRLAIAVPKKVSNKAVIRHRLRRRVAAVVRKHKESMTKGWVGILFIKPPAGPLSFQDFEKELVHFFDRAGVMKKSQR